MASRGILIKSNLAGGAKAVYEPRRAEHRHNLVCSCCQRAIPVDGCPLDEFVKTLGERTGFDVTGHRLEIYGLCRDCKGK
jgi:Fur family ferric uptake transcriptional regulator